MVEKFSLYTSGIYQTKPVDEVDLNKVIEMLKEPKPLIDKIRAEPDKDKRMKLKEGLHYVTFGGTFTTRKNENLIKSSGYACFDVDEIKDIETLEKMKKRYIDNEYTHFCFVSPSGNGLKFVVKIPKVKSNEEYKQYWRAIEKYYCLEEGDTGTKDIARACYISVDENPYYNPDSYVFEDKYEEQEYYEAPAAEDEDGEETTEVKDTSRSAAEFKQILLLLKKEKTKREIYDEMNLYAKWANGTEAYRTITYDKAEAAHLAREVKKEEARNTHTTIFRQLAKDFYEEQPYFFDSAKLWWLWNEDEHFWENKDEIDVMNKFDKCFNQESEKGAIKSGILEALRKFGRLKHPEEVKPTWIQFKKQIHDIETGYVFDASPEYFSSNPIPWTVGLSEDTPTIDKLFSSWVNDEDLPKLYELVAFSMVPKMFIHAFHFLHSKPGMGKSTFVNLLIKFLGSKNVASTSINRINANPRFEAINWHKKLLITMSEVSNANDLTNSGLINQATGEDPIRAEIKGSGGFDFVNYGKFIYPTNKLLRIDSEDGFGRRVRIIKFKTRFEKEKDILSDIPEEEFNNLIKKCLRIAKELYFKRRFTGDVDISERMDNYQEASRTLLERFIQKECDITDFEAKMTYDEFYAHYCRFIVLNQEKHEGKSNVRKELRDIGYETTRHNWKEDNPQYNETLNTVSDGYVKKATLFGIKLKSVDKMDKMDS